MPELTEVEITRRMLEQGGLLGRSIARVGCDYKKMVRSPLSWRGLARYIENRKVECVDRHGKVLFLFLGGDGERVLAFHLRMSGRLLLQDGALRDRHVHFRAEIDDGRALAFRDVRKLGWVWYGEREAMRQEPYLANLGPDMLGLSTKAFAERVRGRRGMLKPLLLRQDVVSGIGNILADESLWEARLHPARRVETFAAPEIRRLHGALARVIERLLKSHEVRTGDNRSAEAVFGGRFKVYGKKGAPCPRCRAPLQRITLASRGTVFCPKCQCTQL